MSTTDIPNGYVARGPAGKAILVDFDDNGKALPQATEMSIGGWPETIMKGGFLKSDIIVLVHSVRGEEQVLLKRILVCQLKFEDNPITVEEVARRGWLNATAEKMRRDYLEKLKKEEILEDVRKALAESKT
jgi:hypothetical protein